MKVVGKRSFSLSHVMIVRKLSVLSIGMQIVVNFYKLNSPKLKAKSRLIKIVSFSRKK
jgi:hypothetical protein